MKICAVFDLDGTLVDSRADLCTGVNLMRLHFGLPPLSVDEVVSYVGNGTETLCERAIADSDIKVAEALPIMKQYYREHILDRTQLYPGVAEGLRLLYDAGIPMLVISNKPEQPSRIILEGLNVAGYFLKIIGGDSGFNLKPAPDALLHGAGAAGADPANSYMVGDNYTDLAAARRAGMIRVFAGYGFGALNGEAYDFRVGDFTAAAGLILSRAAAPAL